MTTPDLLCLRSLNCIIFSESLHNYINSCTLREYYLAHPHPLSNLALHHPVIAPFASTQLIGRIVGGGALLARWRGLHSLCAPSPTSGDGLLGQYHCPLNILETIISPHPLNARASVPGGSPPTSNPLTRVARRSSTPSLAQSRGAL
jgi:hypothetical protein